MPGQKIVDLFEIKWVFSPVGALVHYNFGVVASVKNEHKNFSWVFYLGTSRDELHRTELYRNFISIFLDQHYSRHFEVVYVNAVCASYIDTHAALSSNNSIKAFLCLENSHFGFQIPLSIQLGSTYVALAVHVLFARIGGNE